MASEMDEADIVLLQTAKVSVRVAQSLVVLL